MLRGFSLLLECRLLICLDVHYLIFGRLLLVGPCAESVLFQCLHQYQLGVRVHLHLPEYAELGQYDAGREPFYLQVLGQRFAEEDEEVLSTGSFMRCRSLCLFNCSISSPSYQYLKPPFSKARAWA